MTDEAKPKSEEQYADGDLVRPRPCYLLDYPSQLYRVGSKHAELGVMRYTCVGESDDAIYTFQWNEIERSL